MKLIYLRDTGILKYYDKVIGVQCRVRTEIDGLRKLSEKPVYTENVDGSDGVPFMPRAFPKGTWKILNILPKDDPYEAPFFISTDARQLVDEWTIVDGHYGVNTGRQVWDWGYGFHCSTSSTTLGCGRVLVKSALLQLIQDIKDAWARKEVVEVEVC